MDLTTKEFADIHRETTHNTRQLCERGKIIGAYKIDAPGQGMWLIPHDAVIVKLKRGRKIGWRKHA